MHYQSLFHLVRLVHTHPPDWSRGTLDPSYPIPPAIVGDSANDVVQVTGDPPKCAF